MVGNLVNQQFLEARDWPFGSALALLLMSVLLLVLIGQARVLRRQREIRLDA